MDFSIKILIIIIILVILIAFAIYYANFLKNWAFDVLKIFS